ncbi:MAG TPA: hypothetical protein PKW41_14545, partial [Clostridia bacterium]|nr:hypothetical protein [Clostridia bacterium]
MLFAMRITSFVLNGMKKGPDFSIKPCGMVKSLLPTSGQHGPKYPLHKQKYHPFVLTGGILRNVIASNLFFCPYSRLFCSFPNTFGSYEPNSEKLIARAKHTEVGKKSEITGYDALYFTKNSNAITLWLGQAKAGGQNYCRKGIKDDLNSKFSSTYFSDTAFYIATRTTS